MSLAGSTSAEQLGDQPPRVSSRRRPGNRMPGRRLMILLAVGPLLIFFPVFVFFPMLFSLAMSFFEWNPAALRDPYTFIGLDNYYYALFEDTVFFTATKNTIYYSALRIIPGTALVILLAVGINSRTRLREFLRASYFLPVLTSAVAASLLWQWIYQPRFGLINTTLRAAGEALGLQMSNQPIMWLQDPNLVIPSLVVMMFWQTGGYPMMIFLAGLQGIPDTLYEAARVDGASPWHTFRHITLPLLQPATTFVLITGFIGALQIFTPMYVMTGGGPVDASMTVVLLLYREAFIGLRFGYAAAISVLLFVIIMAVTAAQLRIGRMSWEY